MHSVFLLFYFFIRVLSLFTFHSPFLNHVIAGFCVLSFLYLGTKKLSTAWLLLAIELLIDGAGHFFEFKGLLVRTWFLGIFALLWVYKKYKEKKIEIFMSRSLLIPLTLVGVVLAWSIGNGFLKHHSPMFIVQDTILYLFLFLVFPAIEFHERIQKISLPLLQSFITGSALFSLVTFFIYSSGFGTLPDTYYHWFRNIAGGKITDLGDSFFRIVLSEHLFIVPILLVLTSCLIKNPKNKKLWWLVFFSSLVLVLNFSRIYFVALAVGIIILLIKNNFKTWFRVSGFVSLCILFCFSSLYFVASRGKTFGLDLLGLRIGGATSPVAETSGAIRLAILPDALNTIKLHPWLGSGLGTTVTYTDPATQKKITRTQFDWGYLEVLAELGSIGTLIFLSFLFSVLFSLARLAYSFQKVELVNVALWRGLFAGAISLFVINITTPALFQGFGILYFVFLMVVLSKQKILTIKNTENAQSH